MEYKEIYTSIYLPIYANDNWKPELDFFSIKTSGFNLRNVENIINNREKAIRRYLNVLGAVSLPFVEICVEKQFAHAND